MAAVVKAGQPRLYEDVDRHKVPLPEAISAVNEELDEFGLTSFDAANAEERDQAVAASMSVSLRQLRSDAKYGRIQVDETARFQELAIFPEDAVIPVSVVALLWGETDQLSAKATERLWRRLADLSLLLSYDQITQTIQLHDVFRRYLIDQATNEQYQAWQEHLVNGYEKKCGGEWHDLPDDDYVYQNLLWHMQEAGQQDKLEQLLFNYDWLDAKLQVIDVLNLINDFDLRQDTSRHSQLGSLQHALQMSINVLAWDKNQLASQLNGRLSGLGNSWRPLVDAIQQQERVSWIQAKEPNLTPPGGKLLYTLSGHSTGVDYLLLTGGGRLITSCRSRLGRSSDRMVKVWDIEQGFLLHNLEGHTSGVDNLLLTGDGCLITSGRKDHTVKVWDIERGVLLHSLEGHTAGVDNLLLTGDGRLISSCSSRYDSSDHTVKVWDIEVGVLLHSLEGHAAGVDNLLLTGDGRLISFCSRYDSIDHTVKVWDIERSVLLHSFNSHLPVKIIKFLPLSGYCIIIRGEQLAIWQLDTAIQVAGFTADGPIESCQVASDDTIIVGDGLGRVHFLTLVEQGAR